MEAADAETFLGENTKGVLITLRADGRPQSSNIAYSFADGVARISVTDTRAKTANLRRDGRAVLHVIGEDSWYQYVSASGTAELTPLTTTPGDDTGKELLEVYNAVAGEPHPDPDEFYQAMVDDKRLAVRFRPDSYAGMV